jgi:hypothetical protein
VDYGEARARGYRVGDKVVRSMAGLSAQEREWAYEALAAMVNAEHRRAFAEVCVERAGR